MNTADLGLQVAYKSTMVWFIKNTVNSPHTFHCPPQQWADSNRTELTVSGQNGLASLISLTVRNLWSHLYLGPNIENTSGGLLSYSALQNWFRLVPVEWQDQGITMRFYRGFKIKHYKAPWQPMLELTVCKYSWRLLLLEDYFIIWFSKKEKGGNQPQRARRIRWSWSM